VIRPRRRPLRPRLQAGGQAERDEHRWLLEGGDLDHAAVFEAQHGKYEREERGLAGTAEVPGCGVPIFVPTHHAPTGTLPGNVRFVTDGIESCVEQAKAAAGDRDVMLHGAYTARECLQAQVLDVLEIQLIPVLFGQGRRLFDGLGPDHIELRLMRALESPSAVHLRYEVRYA
jgi:RibD C-terminal domain